MLKMELKCCGDGWAARFVRLWLAVCATVALGLSLPCEGAEPSGRYRRVNWIENYDTSAALPGATNKWAAINTVITPTADLGVRVDYEYKCFAQAGGYMVGALSATDKPRFYYVSVNKNGNWRAANGNKNVTTIADSDIKGPGKVVNERYEVTVQGSKSGLAMTVRTGDGTVGSKNIDSAFSSGTGFPTLGLFASHSGTNLSNPSYARLYACEMWTTNGTGVKTVLRDFVPCFDATNKKFGVWDKVGGTFYGTGTANPFYGPMATIPSSVKFAYDGNKHGIPVPENGGYTITSGNVSETEPGSYSTTVALKDGYVWADKTIAPRTVTWSIIGECTHEFGPWTVETPATFVSAGTRVRTCSLCDAVVSEPYGPYTHPETDDAGCYVTAGLVHQWDGIRNAGRDAEHDSTATTWTDLVGSETLTLGSGVAFTDNALKRISGTSAFATGEAIKGAKTVELVFKRQGADQWAFLLSLGEDDYSNGRGVLGIELKAIGSNRHGYFTSERATTKGDFVTVSFYPDVYTNVNTQQKADLYTMANNLFVDGLAVPNSSTDENWSNTPVGFMLGARTNNSSNVFKGEIFACRVYDRRLDPVDLVQNAAMDRVRFTTCAHDGEFGPWTVVTRATSLSAGTRVHTCGKCGAKISEPYGPLAGVMINEIVSSNDKTAPTKNGGQGLDWIEVYNSSEEAVDLTGWRLTDNPAKASKAVEIQNPCTIPAGGYQVIYIDKDYANFDASEPYARLGLSSSGETLALYDKDGLVCQVAFPALMKDVSYGLKPGTTDEWGYFKTPTPGKANTEKLYTSAMTPKVTFSEPHGYKTEAFNVTLSCSDGSGAAIYYTTNGASPTTASIPYTGPIHIDRTTALRAAVLDENALLQYDTSATYIFLKDVYQQTPENRPVGFPLYSDGTDTGTYKMYLGIRPDVVNGSDRDKLDRSFTNGIDTLSIVIDTDCLFNSSKGIYNHGTQDGREWERPMVLEGISPKNPAVEFTIPSGLRIRGGYSRNTNHPKHAFRFYFREEYGEDKLVAPLFGDEGTDTFKKMDLRCSQNYSWAAPDLSGTDTVTNQDTFVHEVFSRDMQREMGEPYTRSRYYHLYLNGVYWGLYQTQERGDEDFAESYLGGDADDYDLIKKSDENTKSYPTYAAAGTMDAWSNLWHIAVNEGFGDGHEANFMKILGRNPDGSRNTAYPILLDLTNMIVYVISSQYTADSDTPASVAREGYVNNLYELRNRIDDETGTDHRNGFISLRHDAEHTLGTDNTGDKRTQFSHYTNDVTTYGTIYQTAFRNVTASSPAHPEHFGQLHAFNPCELHWRLCSNDTYRLIFADLVQKHCLAPDGILHPDNAWALFQSRMNEVGDAMVAEAARWGTKGQTWQTWYDACLECKKFIDNRLPYFIQHYRNRGWFPSIDAPLADVESGEVSEGTVVNFTNVAAGVGLYITTDGADPMNAEVPAGTSVTLASTPCTVKARTMKDGEWSALTEIAYEHVRSDSYYFKGEYDGSQTLYPSGDECTVVLDGAKIPGGLVLPDGVKYNVIVSNGVSQVGTITGPGAHIALKGDDDGEGVLSLTGADTLIAVSNLIVKSGKLAVTSTVVTAEEDIAVISLNGRFELNGGSVDLDLAPKDCTKQIFGIQLNNKSVKDAKGEDTIFAELKGGEFKATIGGVKSSVLKCSKGSVDASFEKNVRVDVMLAGPEARFVNFDGKIKIKKTCDIKVDVSDAEVVTNATAFKSGKSIKISGGKVVVNVPGAGSEAFECSYDGKDLETGVIEITGGTVEVVADDDCFNADTLITVSGGLIYARSYSNDCFDSNGNMEISGGTVIAFATAEDCEAFDVEPKEEEPKNSLMSLSLFAAGDGGDGEEHVLTISGGTIFATGGEGSAWPANLDKQTTLWAGEGLDAETYSRQFLTVADADGTTRMTVGLPELPGETCSILATAPNMAADAEPTVSPASPLKGDQDFHEFYVSEPEPTGTTLDYAAQSDLYAMWDGIENVARGVHEDSPEVWQDIVGGHVTTREGHGGHWGENCFIEGSSTDNSCFWIEDPEFINMLTSGQLTVEICCSHDPQPSDATYEDWFGFGNTSVNLWLKLDLRPTDFGVEKPPLAQGLHYRRYQWDPASAKVPKNDILAWGKPQYMAVTCDGKKATLYGDGTNVVHTYEGTHATTDGVFTFGGFAKDLGSRIKNGRIYAVRIYRRRLTKAEIQHNRDVDMRRFVEADRLLTIAGAPENGGAVEPDYGTRAGYAAGDAVALKAHQTVVDPSGIEWTCTGYTAKTNGVAWTSGTFEETGVRNVEFDYPADVTEIDFTWQWAVRYRVRAEAGEGGTVAPTEQWVPAGSSASIAATADSDLAFVEWTGDVPDGRDRTNPLELTSVTGAVSVAARFGNAQDIANAKLTLSGSTAYTYDGSEHTLTVDAVVAVGNRPLTPDVDYEVTGVTAATDAGTYVVTVTGKGAYTGTQTVEWTITHKDVAEIEWTYDATNFWYTGAADARPTVSATSGSVTLRFDRDFTVTNWAGTTAYATNAVLPIGGGYVTRVYGIGNFSGTIDLLTFSVTRQELSWTNASGDGAWASERWTLAEKPGMGNDGAREPRPTKDVAVYLQPTNGQENSICLESGATPFYSVATRGKDGATRLHDGVLPLTSDVTAGAGGRIVFENVTFTNANGNSTVYNVYPSGRGGQVTYLGNNRFDVATVGTASYYCAPGFGNGDNSTNLFMNGNTTVGTALHFTGTTTRDLYLVLTNATLQLTKIANAESQRLHVELKPGADNCGEDKAAMLTLTAAPTFNANTFASVEAVGLSAGVYNLVSMPTNYNILAATSPFAPERLLANTRCVGGRPAIEVVTNDTVQTVRLTLAAVQVVDVPVRKWAYAGFTGSAVENPIEPGVPDEGVIYTVTDTNGAPASLDELVDCGAYRLTATLQDGYGWADGTTGSKDYVFAIIDLGRYEAVPWVYSNNGYLNTGIAIQKGVSADLSFFTTANRSTSYLLAGKGNGNSNIEYLAALRDNTANLYASVGSTTVVTYPDGGKSPAVANNESNRVSVALGTDNTLAMTVENERLGSQSASASVGALTPDAKTLCLLARNSNGTFDTAVEKFALYSATIWTNGTVTAREYLPFFDTERVRYGLYDIATGTFNESTRTAYPFCGPNDEFVWVGSEEDPGSGDWNDAQCWDYLGYGRGIGWPGQRTTDVAVFTSGTYRVHIPVGLGGKTIREYRDEPGVNLTVWTESADNSDRVTLGPGYGTVRGYVRQEYIPQEGASYYRKNIFCFNGGQPFEDYPHFYGTVEVVRNKEGLPFGSAFQYKGTNSTFVLEDCIARQGTYGYVFIGIYCADEDKDMPTRLVLTNSSWITTTTAKDANSVGRNATLVYRNSTHMTGVISSHWGGYLDMSDSEVWYTSLKNTVYGQEQGIEEGDTIYLKGMEIRGGKSKFAVSDKLAVTGPATIVWPENGFSNLTVEVSSGTYEGQYKLDLGLSPTPAPVLAGTSADFSAADLTVDVRDWRGYLVDGGTLPKRYPLVRTGSLAVLPTEYTVLGVKAAVGTLELTDDAEGIDLVIDYPVNLTNSFPQEVFDITWDQADDGWRAVLKEDLTGPWEIADDIGRVILDLDGHTITGTNGVDGAGGDAIVFTQMDPNGGLDEPTTLILRDGDPQAHGGEPGIRGGDGASGPTPGDGGAGITTNGEVRDISVIVGDGAVVRGGNGGNGMNEQGVGVDGGKGGKGSTVRYAGEGVGASVRNGDDGGPATAWAWCEVPEAAAQPQTGDGVARIGNRLWFYRRNDQGSATFDFDLLRERGWVPEDKTIHFVAGEIPVATLTVPATLVAGDGYGELAFAGANWAEGGTTLKSVPKKAGASKLEETGVFVVTASEGQTRSFRGIVFAGADAPAAGAQDAATHDGGAILLTGGALEVKDCAFDGCRTGDAGQFGGAICAVGLTGDSLVTNATFRNCSVGTDNGNGNGGAIYATAEDALNFTVVDSVFESNLAQKGGAISTSRDRDGTVSAIRLVLKGDEFVGNAAVYEGGAIRAGGDVVVADADEDGATVFEDNFAGWYGGAIVLDCEFGSAGAASVSIGSNTLFTCNVVSNDNCDVAYGGAIAMMLPIAGCTLDVVGATFTGNVAYCGGSADGCRANGGAIFSMHSALTGAESEVFDFTNRITKTAFYGNVAAACSEAEGDDYACGGAVMGIGGHVVIDNCVFGGNDAVAHDYDAWRFGGALEIEGDLEPAGLTVLNSTFRRSKIEAVNAYLANVGITNCVIVGNGEEAGDVDLVLDDCEASLAYSAYGALVGEAAGERNLPGRTTAIYADDTLRLDETGFNPAAAFGLAQPGVTDFDGVGYGSRPVGSAMGAYEAATETLVVHVDGSRRYDGSNSATGIAEFAWSVTDAAGGDIGELGDIGDITNLFEVESWEYAAADVGEYCGTNDTNGASGTIAFTLPVKVAPTTSSVQPAIGSIIAIAPP